jgi:hypothetical protein
MSQRQGVISITLTALSSLAISIFLVHRFDTEPLGGYVAGYTVGAAFGLSALAILTGIGLTIFRRTRWAGKLTLAAALAIPCIFTTGVRISESRGWISWVNQPLVEIFGPKVKAGEIVYYKSSVTDAQRESFEQSVLYDRQPDGKKSDFIPGITYFARLGPLQARGHDGFAIGVSPNMSRSALVKLRISLAQSPLVFGVFHDKAPDDVPIP